MLILAPIESSRSPLSIGAKISTWEQNHDNLQASLDGGHLSVTRIVKFIGLRNVSFRAETLARTIFRAENCGLIVHELY